MPNVRASFIPSGVNLHVSSPPPGRPPQSSLLGAPPKPSCSRAPSSDPFQAAQARVRTGLSRGCSIIDVPPDVLGPLVGGWHAFRERQRDAPNWVDGQLASSLYCLRPVDLSYTPPDLNLYGVVVNAFSAAAEEAQELVRTLAPGTYSIRENPEDMFERTFEMALAGTRNLDGAENSTTELLRRKVRSWHGLFPQWNTFIDALTYGLSLGNGPLRREQDYILVPIHTADMNLPERQQFRRILPKFRHPRVLFLVSWWSGDDER